MPLSSGERLGHYQIVGFLGAGGMGEVYRATDTRLDREVAIKVSAERFGERFEREARVIASLNHPNICTLHDVGPNYLVMELVEGESPKGPLPLETALKYARQIADALDAAHEKGVVHRDLKPGNIKIKPDGTVKVLDFGLAKIAAVSTSSIENSPTLTIGTTQAGMILGTAAYMSPEQARGKSVDRRADIWAFGVVLYEMLTGEHLFNGEDVTEVLASVVKEQPDLSRAPAPVRRLLEKCLEKDPKKRLQAMGDAWLLLDETAAAKPVREKPGTLKYWVAIAGLALIAVAAGFLAWRHVREEPAPVLRFAVMPPDKATFGGGGIPAVSPDGRHLAFAARVEGKVSLWIRDLDSLAARTLPGTDAASYPLWSPDSRTVAFFALGKLKKVDIAGGPVLTLADALNVGGSWSRDGAILFATGPGKGLSRISAAGGTITPATELDAAAHEVVHRNPWFLPDGHQFLYTASSTDTDKTSIYAGDLNSKSRKLVLAVSSNAVFAPPGFLLFARDRTLMAQPFDPDKLQLSGDAVPVAEQVDFGNSQAQFGASNGVLAYTSGAVGADVQLTWYDRSGKPSGTIGNPANIQWAALSPDGKTVAFDRRDSQTGFYDIWLHDLSRGSESRLTFNSQNNEFPVWSHDGARIAFYSTRDGGSVYQKQVNGTGQDEVLDKDPTRVKRPDDWTRDGQYIIEELARVQKTGSDIWVLPLTGDRKPFPYLQTEFNESQAHLSPDGRWLAYASDETKRREVYVVTFPMPTGKWQVSTNGGDFPVWSRDGKELFFVGADRKLMSAKIGSGAKFEAGVPVALFEVRLGPANPNYAVSSDGRFLVPTPVEQTATVPITAVMNWQNALRK